MVVGAVLKIIPLHVTVPIHRQMAKWLTRRSDKAVCEGSTPSLSTVYFGEASRRGRKVRFALCELSSGG
jgi:hypothetical protein